MTLHELDTNLDGQGETKAMTPTPNDHYLFLAGLTLLIENRDIVFWVACLVQKWSPDIKGLNLAGCLEEFLTLPFNWTVTYVDKSYINEGATMWAFGVDNVERYPYANDNNPQEANKKYGLIVPILQEDDSRQDTSWGIKIDKWKQGGSQAFCAAVQVAAIILHELVHICGDTYRSTTTDAQPGTRHEEEEDGSAYTYPCWDEARMVETMFIWFMTQRYTCLGNNESVFTADKASSTILSCCNQMPDPFYFARSISSQDQIMSDCQYKAVSDSDNITGNMRFP